MNQKTKKVNVKIIIAVVIIVVAVVGIIGIVVFTSGNKEEIEIISYSELIENINQIKEIEIKKDSNNAKVKYKEKNVVIPSIDALTEYIKENNSNIKIKIK